MDKIKSGIIEYIANIMNWTSTRVVYLLMSVVLFFGALLHSWGVILFVIVMLQIAVWTGFCPSKWLFEKLSFRKTDL